MRGSHMKCSLPYPEDEKEGDLLQRLKAVPIHRDTRLHSPIINEETTEATDAEVPKSAEGSKSKKTSTQSVTENLQNPFG